VDEYTRLVQDESGWCTTTVEVTEDDRLDDVLAELRGIHKVLRDISWWITLGGLLVVLDIVIRAASALGGG